MYHIDRRLKIFIGGLFLFCVDRFLKYLSITIYSKRILLTNLFGWSPFQNTGIAFSLPVPSHIAIILSVPIFALIVYFLYIEYKNLEERNRMFGGLILLFFGALSNFLDRILYSATLDYLLLGISFVNIADILIFVGISLLFQRKPLKIFSR